MLKGEDIICIANTSWFGNYAKSTVQILERLATNNRVLFVEYPYTIKDIYATLRGKQNAPVKRMLGVFDYDAEGKFVTPLIHGKECAFVYFDAGIARCAIEKAFQEKLIPFAKPISCHLYPIRIKSTPVNDLLNYHKWPICKNALIKGHNEKIPLYQFLEGALIRKYGRSWYNKLAKLLR